MTRLFADPFVVTAFAPPSRFTKTDPLPGIWRGDSRILVGSSEKPKCSVLSLLPVSLSRNSNP
jgi:hypothetical protein